MQKHHYHHISHTHTHTHTHSSLSLTHSLVVERKSSWSANRRAPKRCSCVLGASVGMGSAGPISAAECTSHRSRTVLVFQIRGRRASVSVRDCIPSLSPPPPSPFREVASGLWIVDCVNPVYACAVPVDVRQALERECFPLVELIWRSCTRTSAHSPHSSLLSPHSSH